MNGDIAFQIVFMLVFGGICSAIANSKGRSALGWFFAGFFLGCIGLVIVLCLSNEREKRAQWESQNVENRRLQQQLRQEQMKSESLRQHTLARLDKHDDVLGIDTRQSAPQLEMDSKPRDPFAPISQMERPPSQPKYEPESESEASAESVAYANPVSVEKDPADDEQIWYYEYGGTERGPVSVNELIKLKSISVLHENSHVREEGEEVYELAKMKARLAKVLYS